MELNEREKVLRALTGDHQAYGDLVGAYQGMVFAVALNVTGNHSDSEDVLQEAFLRAYQKLRTLSDPTKFGPWLHVIARRVALQFLRDRRRVPVAETEEALEDRSDPDALTPAEHYAKAELSQTLWEEVAELPPRTREAILLFYVEGFSIKGAAAFLGISEGAMKMRLDFGRDKLRDVLTQKREDELRRQRPSEKALALILAGLPKASAPTAATGAMGSGATWVAGAKVVAAAVVALAIGAGLLFAFRGPLPFYRPSLLKANPPLGQTPESGAAATASGGRKELAEAGNPSTPATPNVQKNLGASKAAPPAPNGDAMCVCEVLRANAVPVAGTLVDLEQILRPEEKSTATAYRKQLTTNEQGEAVFDRIPEGAYIVSAQDGQDIARAYVAVRPYARQRLIVQPGQTLSGVVHDQDGKAISGARIIVLGVKAEPQPQTLVSLDFRSREVIDGWRGWVAATTAKDGAFTTLLPGGAQWRFLVKAEGYASADVKGVVPGTPAEFVLGHGGTVSGHVTVAGSGKPAAGVHIAIAAERYDEDRLDVDTGADGAYTFSNLCPGKYVFDVLDAKIAVAQAQPTVEVRDGETSALDVAVSSGATISGRVIEKHTGKGVANALVRTGRRDLRSVTTDSNGAFTFSGVPAGGAGITVRALPGYRIADEGRSTQVQVEAGAEQTGVELTLVNCIDGPPTLRGHVLDANGKAVPGAFVVARIEEQRWETVVVRANADGAYSIGGLAVTGNLKARAFLPGLTSQEKGPLTLTADGLDGVDLVLEPTGGIAGKLIAKSGKALAVPGASIDLLNYWPMVWGQNTVVVMKDGLFQIPDLPAGKYELGTSIWLAVNDEPFITGIRLPEAVVEVASGKISKDVTVEFDDEAYARSQAWQTSPEEKQRQKNAERERHRNDWGVKGQVVDALSGAPVTDCEIESKRSFGTSRSSARDPQGRFTIEPGEGPSVELKISAAHYVPGTATAAVEQVHDGYAQIVVKLKPGMIVSGTVVDPDGKPVVSAKVCANELPNGAMPGRFDAVSTDGAGAFQLDTVDSGPLRIGVEHPSFALSWTDVTAAPGKTAPITITLSHGGSLEGDVSSAGAPLPNAGISLGRRVDGGSNEGPRDRIVAVGATGHYRIDKIMPGEMLVAAFPPNPEPRKRLGQHMQTQIVHIQEGGVARADFTFEPEDAKVQGTVTIHGVPSELPSSVRFYRSGSDTNEQWTVDSVHRSGDYESPSLPAGEISADVRATTPSGTRLTRQLTFTLASGETARKDVDFSGSGSVSGKVSGGLSGERISVFAATSPVTIPEGSSVTSLELYLKDPVASASVKDGVYRLDCLPPGDYTLYAIPEGPSEAVGEGYRAATGTAKISGDENAVCDLTIERRH